MSVFSIAKKSFYGRIGTALATLFSARSSSKIEPRPSIETPTTKEGVSIPVLFGTRDIKEPILAWYGDFKKVSSEFYLSAIFILCYGKSSKISRIAYGDKLLWSGSNFGEPTNGTIQKNNHFSDGSGLYGSFTFDNGANNEPADVFLSSKTGLSVKYSFLSNLILKDICIGTVANMKQPSFRVTNLGGEKGSAEWNAENAEIFTPEKSLTVSEIYSEEEIDDWSFSLIRITLDEPYAVNVKLDYNYYDYSTELHTYEVAFIFGKGLTNEELIEKVNNEDFDYRTSFIGGQMIGSIEVPSENAGFNDDTTKMLVWRFIRVSAYDPNVTTVSLSAKIPALSDMNPAHIIYYLLTGQVWGCGLSSSDIDENSFLYTASKLKEENFGLSILWSKDSSIEEIIKEVLEHINGVLLIDRKTGKFKLNLIRNDYNIALLTVLDASNIESIDNFKRTSDEDLCNTVTLTYYDTLLGAASGLTVSNTALVSESGKTKICKIDFPGISNQNTAKIAAKRELIAASTPVEMCTIKANMAAKDLDIGDAFVLDYPKYTDAPTVFRVIKISFGDGISNSITIEAVKDIID